MQAHCEVYKCKIGMGNTVRCVARYELRWSSFETDVKDEAKNVSWIALFEEMTRVCSEEGPPTQKQHSGHGKV